MNSPHTDGATRACPLQPALKVRLKTDLAGLAPAYFGLIMRPVLSPLRFICRAGRCLHTRISI